MRRILVTAWFLILATATGGRANDPNGSMSVTADDYARADLFRHDKVAGTIKNASVTPHWLAQGDEFWYLRATADGHEFVLVDSATGRRRPAFDHETLAEALGAALGYEVVAGDLPFTSFSYGDGPTTVRPDMPGQRVSCDLERGVCSAEPQDPPPQGVLVSPDGALAVFARDDNLWVRDLTSGDERALTSDGAPYYSYGKLPDSSLVTIRFRLAGYTPPPTATVWSPDSRRVVVTRLDERHVETLPFVQFAPPDRDLRPVLHQLKYSLTGEEPVRADVFVIDLATRRAVWVDLPRDLSLLIADSELWWSDDNGRFYALGSRGLKGDHAVLVEVEATTGQVRPVIEETTDTHIHLNPLMYRSPNVRVLGGGAEVVWFSERSGWGHLYLCDGATGAVKNPITSGDWLVHDIVRVDEDRRQIFFTAGGREPGRDPYHRYLYRVGLDGSGLRLLTPEDAFHEIEGQVSAGVTAYFGAGQPPQQISPDGRFLVDIYSTASQPPVSVLRSVENGRLIATVEEADAGALYDRGWTPPERFVVKAADGATDLYGIILFPSDFDPARKYPVIDAFYGGPQVSSVPHTFMSNAVEGMGRRSLAELGFIVVTLDSRGTVYRSKAFHDYSFLNVGEYGLEDQIGAIRQLAERYPAMDLDRVGIYGHSFGGYGSARAILAHPEFFKVAVSSAGVHNFASIYHGFEIMMGLPDYGDGRTTAFDSREFPDNYLAVDNRALAANLKGHLLIAWGELDENVPPNTLVQLVDSLIAADKRFDVIYMPNADHSFATDAWFIHRRWDYFVEHLMGAVPPGN